MDHAEARELLDLAALEPGGLERLMAGDTPAAIALAGHLAGCPDCTEEFSRLRRSSAILRAVIATQPPPELRERTLAFAAAVGRPRGADSPAMAEPQSAAAAGPSAEHAAPVAPGSGGRHDAGVAGLGRWAAVRLGPPRGAMSWLAAAAALVVLSVGLTAFAVGSQKDGATRRMSLELAGLTQVAQWTARLDAQPDVQHVLLTAAGSGTSADAQTGTLVFSAATRMLVVVADGLTEPPDGQEYRCWVDVAGSRHRLGKMYVSGDLGYWVGDSDVLPSVTSGSLFGVSLVDASTGKAVKPMVMSGTLQET